MQTEEGANMDNIFMNCMCTISSHEIGIKTPKFIKKSIKFQLYKLVNVGMVG